MTYKLRSFVEAVSESETSPQTCPYDRFVGLEHYDPGELEITRYTDTSLLSSSVKVFHKNDILIARRNVYLKRAGIVFFDGLTSGDSIILRVLPDCEHLTGIPFHDALKWLPIVLNSSSFWAYANKHADGMNSKRISKEMLLEYEFPKLSLNEINDISSKVWAAHNLKNSYTKLLEATDEMVKSRFIEMFKGDNKVPLGDICNIEKGATITRNNVLPGEVPVVAGGQEPSCYHNVANREAGAITVSASGAYAGYINFWNCPIFASDCNTIISKDDEKTDQTFVYFGLRAMQKQIYGLQKGGAQPHVYGKDLQKFMFPCPSYAKQIEFSKMAKQADKSKFELKQAIEKIDKVMRALMQ